jgi:hypothetical protein
MKKLMMILMVLIVVCAATVTAYADVYVRGYYRSNSTYVQPHYRSNPDRSFYNNWSTYPNVNPYTGATGTRQIPSYRWGSSNCLGGSYLMTPRYSSPRFVAP